MKAALAVWAVAGGVAGLLSLAYRAYVTLADRRFAHKVYARGEWHHELCLVSRYGSRGRDEDRAFCTCYGIWP